MPLEDKAALAAARISKDPKVERLRQLMDQKAQALRLFREGVLSLEALNDQLKDIKRDMAQVKSS